MTETTRIKAIDGLTKTAGDDFDWGAFWGSMWDDLASGKVRDNLSTGLRSAGRGALDMVASTPGFLAGAAAGLTSGIKNSFTPGVSWGDTLARAWQTGSDSYDFVNNIGTRNFNIAKLKRSLAASKERDLEEYLVRNNINPENLGTGLEGHLNRWALNGISMAEAAGGGLAGYGAFSPLKLLSGVRHPIEGISKLRNFIHPANYKFGLGRGALAALEGYGTYTVSQGNMESAKEFANRGKPDSDMFDLEDDESDSYYNYDDNSNYADNGSQHGSSYATPTISRSRGKNINMYV